MAFSPSALLSARLKILTLDTRPKLMASRVTDIVDWERDMGQEMGVTQTALRNIKVVFEHALTILIFDGASRSG